MKFSKYSLLTAALLGVAVFFLPQTDAQTPDVYTAGHGDLDITFSGSAYVPRWNLDAGATVNGSPLASTATYASAALIADSNATSTTPSTSLTWLGVPGGTTVYRLGNASYPPNLGFATHIGSDSDWLNSTITITLSGWSPANPGAVALRSGTSSSAVTWFSTYAPSNTVNSDNTWDFDVGVGHAHLVWYFSAPGYYELEFTWSGTYVGGGGSVPVSGTSTFGFHVGP